MDHGYMLPCGMFGPEKPAKKKPKQKWVPPPRGWRPVPDEERDEGIEEGSLMAWKKARMMYKVSAWVREKIQE